MKFHAALSPAGAAPGWGPGWSTSDEVVHCTFPLGTATVKCRCVLKGQSVEVTTEDGHLYVATLPCQAARLFTLGSGLLVERVPFAEELPLLQSSATMFFRADGKMPKDLQGAWRDWGGWMGCWWLWFMPPAVGDGRWIHSVQPQPCHPTPPLPLSVKICV